MATIRLPTDFKEFLKLLNSRRVEYLLIGGYAVGYHGYPHATADMDIWISLSKNNTENVVAALKEFGFNVEGLSAKLFLKDKQIIRMGIPPLRIEIVTTISGISFADCYPKRIIADIDGVEVNLIDLDNLKKNKQAAGRHKDLDDLENLP